MRTEPPSPANTTDDDDDALTAEDIATLGQAVASEHWLPNVLAAFDAALAQVDDPEQRRQAGAVFNSRAHDAALRAPRIPDAVRGTYVATRIARALKSAVRAARMVPSDYRAVEHVFVEKLWQGGPLKMAERNTPDNLDARLRAVDAVRQEAARRGRSLSISQALGEVRSTRGAP